tara:strand:+ start:375 stop:566 length:192 start_codon:yes stop_codon:yes gene_type:complete
MVLKRAGPGIGHEFREMHGEIAGYPPKHAIGEHQNAMLLIFVDNQSTNWRDLFFLKILGRRIN